MQNNRSFWSYLLKAKGRHGVHSPFVFQLADTCLTTKVEKNFNIYRKKWYAELKTDKNLFTVNDLGAGSKHLTQQRSRSQLFKNSSSKGIYGDVLYKLARFYQPSTILELGTSLGIGTVHLKKGAPNAHIITVEGCENTLAQACKSFDYWDVHGITTIRSSFTEFLEHPSPFRYDLIFIDGHHNGAATLDYLERLQPFSHNQTLFIFDDIRWSDDMWHAWKQIEQDERFHVTVDLGRMGLVWKRPEQNKEQFVVRPKVWKTRFV